MHVLRRNYARLITGSCTALALIAGFITLAAPGAAAGTTRPAPSAVSGPPLSSAMWIAEQDAVTARRAELHILHMKHIAHLAHLAWLKQQAELARQAAATPVHVITVSHPVAVTHYSGSTSMQQCIIAAESGGNPYIWNATGHWGLYQFSYATWVHYGGDPALFGTVGPAYQTQIFWNAVAKNGYNDWTPYDHC